jgi:chloramphenicol O-acetyltransferase type A
MRQIDMQTWSRREHFLTFNSYDHPHFNICANVDLAQFNPAVKDRDLSITAALVYVLTRAANSIPEFRYRIRGQGVIEHQIVHPSFTVLLNEDIFSYCEVKYTEEFPQFARRVSERIAFVKENPTLANEPGRDDYLFMTAMPWVSFTSVMHPLNLSPPDSVPRIAWGKFFENGQKLKMPLSVQAHHALMDGIHLARYYALVQELLDDPEELMLSS